MARTERSYRKSRNALISALEPLETRRMFSTINWVNEGNDNFAIFGTNENVARQIVNKAISDWEQVIVDFNYDDTGANLNNTFSLTLNAAAMSGGQQGATQITSMDDATDRKPTSAQISLDDAGGGAGWYFDFNVFDDGEYANPINLFAADVSAGGPSGSDFYRAALHEIGQALGINLHHNLKLFAVTTSTGLGDPLDTSRTLLLVQPSGGRYTLTSKGGNDLAAHLWEGDGVGGPSLREHPNDLINDRRTIPAGVNRRLLISDTNAQLLRDVYNYQIQLPSQINTFAANLNEATGVLTINGNLVLSATPEPVNLLNDSIDLEWSGGIIMSVELGDGAVAKEKFFEFSINTIVVNTGDGNDFVHINGLPPNKSVTVNLGDGPDGVVFGGQAKDMSSIASDVTINGGAGENSVDFRDDNALAGSQWTFDLTHVVKSNRTFTLNDIRYRNVFASNAFDDAFFVNATPADTNLFLFGNGGSDVFEIGNGNLANDIRGLINLNGGNGIDFMTLNDAAATAGDNNWTFNGSLIEKEGAASMTQSNLERLTAEAASQDDVFNVAAASVPVLLKGGAGDDTFYIGTGDLDTIARVTVMGGAGDDMLVINDSADTGNDPYTITAGAITKPGNIEGFQAIEINTQVGQETEQTLLIANDGSNLITVNGGRGVEIKARAGNDLIVVNDHVQSSPVVIDTGEGSDNRIDLNSDLNGNVTGELRSNQNLSRLFIRPGARLNVASGSNATIDVALNYSNEGLLDLNDNTVLVRGGAGGASMGLLRQQIAAGHNSGAWNGGSGITSSFSASSPTKDGIGYGTATQITQTEFNGIAISGNDVVLDYTLYGDANLDHQVNLTDFNNLAGNFGQTGKSWAQGDFNYDGTTNLADFNRLAGTFGQTLIQPARSAAGVEASSNSSSNSVASLLDAEMIENIT